MNWAVVDEIEDRKGLRRTYQQLITDFLIQVELLVWSPAQGPARFDQIGFC